MTEVPLVAIVTGAAQGLGAAICIELLKEGYKVCVADIQDDKGSHFVKEQQEVYGSENVIFSNCNVAKEDHFDRVFEVTIKAFGKVDVLVNNAGIVAEQNPRQILEVNLMGTITGCQKAFKCMGKSNGGKGGIVINIASIAGLIPLYKVPVYTASKHGIVGLTRSYGVPSNLETHGIIFAALCPYGIVTDIANNSAFSTAVPWRKPVGKRMSPEYAAKGVLKLLEDRINGSTLVISLDCSKYVGFQEELCDPSLE